MTQSRTHTQTGTQTSTREKVLHVTRKMQADLLAIIDMYEVRTREHGQKLIHDLRLLMEEELLASVQFIWTKTGTNTVLESIRYTPAWGGVEVADSRSGGIGHNPTLKGEPFAVHIYYSNLWQELNDAAKQDIKAQLQLSWGATSTLDYGGGAWSTDKTYAKEELSITRERFKRS